MFLPFFVAASSKHATSTDFLTRRYLGHRAKMIYNYSIESGKYLHLGVKKFVNYGICHIQLAVFTMESVF